MKDLDRRCAKLRDGLRVRIAKLERMIDTHNGNRRVPALRELRDDHVIELHDMTRAHANYDRRFEEACDDPTGQDLDTFQQSE